ncbi:hypothetical protein K461DRAFT_279107, partial [Myriangium duriaei CBS 260.36]
MIVGCGSGMSTVTYMDDVFGLPLSLFHARAQAVVSTLWPLDDDDGAAFSQAFYGKARELLERDMDHVKVDTMQHAEGDKNPDLAQKASESDFSEALRSRSIVDLAKCYQHAVLKL